MQGKLSGVNFHVWGNVWGGSCLWVGAWITMQAHKSQHAAATVCFTEVNIPTDRQFLTNNNLSQLS